MFVCLLGGRTNENPLKTNVANSIFVATCRQFCVSVRVDGTAKNIENNYRKLYFCSEGSTVLCICEGGAEQRKTLKTHLKINIFVVTGR